MAEPRNDAEQRGHCVARRALRYLNGAFPFPIASIASLRVFRQTLAAIRTKHRIRGLSGRSVRVFHQANKTHKRCASVKQTRFQNFRALAKS